MTFADDPKLREQLRLKFPPEQIGHMPKAGMMLDFVGHAAVTDRLNRYAPDWSYTIDEMFTQGGACWLRITMTVGGTSRPEYGDGKDPKEAIGNAIRRAAMRFGVAIDLWSREELEVSPAVSPTARENAAGDAEGPPPAASTSPAPAAPVSAGSEAKAVDHQADVAGGTTSGSEPYGEGGTDPATVEGGSAQSAPAKAGSPSADHEPEWGPSPRPNLAKKGWVVCREGTCEVHPPHQRKEADVVPA